MLEYNRLRSPSTAYEWLALAVIARIFEQPPYSADRMVRSVL